MIIYNIILVNALYSHSGATFLAPSLRLWWLRKIARHKSMMSPVAFANKSMRVTLDGYLLQLDASGTSKSLVFLVDEVSSLPTSCIDQMKLKRNMEESLKNENPM